jgi:phage gp36-like protein
MANFVTAGELKTHMYEEVVNEITRNDDSIIEDAIDTALDEIKGWCSKYNIDTYLATITPSNRNKKLLSVAKDLSAWYLLHLCNVTIDYDKWKDLYDAGVMWLSQVQKGNIVLNLPLATIPGTSPAQNVNPIKWSSNTKRNNHY